MTDTLVGIVIPAYNEEKRIGPTLERIFQFLDQEKLDAQVVLVDDCSSDNTIEVAKQAAKGRPNFTFLKNNVNHGKGYTVKRGMLAAEGKYVLFSDADLSTPIEETLRFLEKAREGYDVIIGSRAMPDSNIVVYQPIYRRLMGKVFNRIVRLLAVRGIRDTQCGFKMFTREAAHAIFPLQRIQRFAFDVEALFLARKSGYKIFEMPVTWKDSPQTRVSTFKDSFSMFSALFTIRMNSLRGFYKKK